MNKIIAVWLMVLIIGSGMMGFVSTDEAEGKVESIPSYDSKSYTSHSPIYIDSNSDFTYTNGVVSGSGTEANPYIIEGWNIDATSAVGIRIENTDAYFIIRNCYIHGGKPNYHSGISFHHVTHGTVDNVTTKSNYCGLAVWYSSNNQIKNCIVYDSYGYAAAGIDLHQSSGNTLSNCVVYDNFGGVSLGQSNNNIISHCAVYNNDGGINLYPSSSNNIINNSVVYNNVRGFFLWSASNNSIIKCNITGNSDYGVKTFNGYSGDPPCADNIVYHNNFINNTNHAYDEGNNLWDNTAEGNYWDDYTGSDSNSDGIGDTPYNIPGGSNKDNYPLIEPVGTTSDGTNGDTNGDTDSDNIVRTPQEVNSWQTALIFAKVSGAHEVSLDVEISVECIYKYKDLQENWHELYSESSNPSYSVPMIPIPSGFDWYVAVIPGLPAGTWDWQGLIYDHRTITASTVKYDVYVDGVKEGSGSYAVAERELSETLPPIVYAMTYDVLNDPTILTETLGLSPKGWTVGAGKQFKSLILAIDDKSIESVNDIKFNYCVNGGNWMSAIVHPDTSLMGTLESAVGLINNVIDTANNYIPGTENDVPTIPNPLFIAYANIPQQNAGCYVEFYATATDSDNNVGTSPRGLYYVDKETSDTKILTIDPNLYLWLFQENIEHFTNVLKDNSDYNISSYITENLTAIKRVSGIIEEYGIVPFRHWEYLGSDYDLYITRPCREVKDILDTYNPDVIFLSNLWLGAQGFSSKIAAPWNWDLKDITVGTKSLMEHIIKYVNDNNAGFIATHGTLSDWVVWLGEKEATHYKVGTRGHIGDELSEIGITQEKTIASLLGMPQLTFWEYFRDALAEQLCKRGKQLVETPMGIPILILGLLIGSTPLQVPYVPFTGTMEATPEAESLDWNIPEEFEIKIPSVYNEFGLKAYTQVGWQLAMPRALAYSAWEKAQEMMPYAMQLYDNLANLIETTTDGTITYTNITDGLDSSLDGALEKLYEYIISANITGDTFDLNIDVAEINATISEVMELTITLTQEAYETFLQYIPVKIVAQSPYALAGIITHDKYWSSKGYRSVYFSFEVEAAEGSEAKNLLKQSVDWVTSWRYRDVTELLGGAVRVGKDLAQKFRENVNILPSTDLLTNAMLLNEESITPMNLYAKNNTSIFILVAHPTTKEVCVTLLNGNAEIIAVEAVDTYLTKITLDTYSNGYVGIGLSADADSSINPVYVTIRATKKPTASFMYSPEYPTDLVTVQFTDGSIDADGYISSWYWDFGDGTTSTLQNPTHQYGDNANYYVSLNVTDNGGARSIISKLIVVLNVAPIAEVSKNITATEGETATFSGIGRDLDGAIVKYEWDFDGDGIYDWNSTITGYANYSYTTPGTYSAVLRVTDDDGDISTASIIVEVKEKSWFDVGDGAGIIGVVTIACASLIVVCLTLLKRKY